MFLNQVLSNTRSGLAGVGLAGLWLLGGCSALHRAGPPAQAAAPSARVVAAVAEESGATTATEAATDEQSEPAGTTTTVIADASAVVSSSAPKDYVVKRGDTLWGIATLFLRDPWQWPEIWYQNPQVQNPHRIYPGDTVHLGYSAEGKPQIQLVRGAGAKLHPMLRGGELSGAIAPIPYQTIASFLSRPSVLSKEQIKAAPYVLALTDEHQIAGAGMNVYVGQYRGGAGERYSVMHVDESLKDPENGRELGYQALYSGAARVLTPGKAAKAVLVESTRETLRGDVLIPDTNPAGLSLVPHVPSRPVNGQIMSVVNGVLLVGQYEVVALNRGSAHGLEAGNVLGVMRAGAEVRDSCARIVTSDACLMAHPVRLPAERAGTLLVFKTFSDLSYALLLSETEPLHIGDHFANP